MSGVREFTKQEWHGLELWRRGRVTRDQDGTLRTFVYENGRLVDAVIVETETANGGEA